MPTSDYDSDSDSDYDSFSDSDSDSNSETKTAIDLKTNKKKKKNNKLIEFTEYYKEHSSDTELWNDKDGSFRRVHYRKKSYCVGIEESASDSEAPNAPNAPKRKYQAIYPIGKIIGKGNYCIARVVRDTDILVLKPLDDAGADLEEAQAKFAFFKTVYPEHFSQLIIADGTYRLFVEKMPGKAYSGFTEVPISDEKSALNIYLSAIQELKRCHAKSIILMDLKADNILFDSINIRSYLIDGGSSTKKDSIISPEVYAEAENIAKKHNFWQIAPECWSKEPVLAKESMDVYSLGILMFSKMEHLINSNNKVVLEPLLKSAINVDPEKRPSLEVLEKNIKLYLSILKSLNQATKTAPASQSGFFSKPAIKTIPTTQTMQTVIHTPYGTD
jgi:serine/threonine protein kinase